MIHGRLSWPFDNPNALAAVVAVLMAAALPWVASRRHLVAWGSICLCLLLAVVLAATGSRGGWVAIAAGGAVACWGGCRDRPGRFAGLAGAFLVSCWLSSSGTRWAASIGDASVGNRLDLWWSALAMAWDNPLGLGVPSGSWASSWYLPMHLPQAGYRTMVSSPVTLLVACGWGIFAAAALAATAALLGIVARLRAEPQDHVAAGAGGAAMAGLVACTFSTLHTFPGVLAVLGLAWAACAGVVIARRKLHRVLPLALATSVAGVLVLLVLARHAAEQHPLVARPVADGALVAQRQAVPASLVRIVVEATPNSHTTRRAVTGILDSLTAAVVSEYDTANPSAVAPACSPEEILVLVGGAGPAVLAQLPATLPAAVVLVDAPLDSPVPGRSIRRLLADWPVPIVLAGADDFGSAGRLVAVLEERQVRARHVADPAQALATARQLLSDQAHAPRFVEVDPVVIREPGQASALVLYRIENRSAATLRLDRLLPLCACYAIDPSAWRDIPAGATGELALLVDLSRFNAAAHKPVVLAVLADDGQGGVTRHLIHGAITIQVRCSLEWPDGLQARLHDGSAQLRLLSNRPDLITDVRLAVDPPMTGTVEARPTGYTLSFKTTPSAPIRAPMAWKADVTLTGGAVERFSGTVASKP